jgi:signal transduction histidine kinase
VEDSAADVGLLSACLEETDAAQLQLTHVVRLSEALRCLQEQAYDVVLLDLGLPDSHGLDTLAQARAQGLGVPIVVLTGLDDDRVGVQAVQQGAQDYLVKGQVDGKLLVRSLHYAMERKRLEEAVRRSELEAARRASLQESLRRIVTVQEGVRKEIAGELHGPVQTRLFLIQRRLRLLVEGGDSQSAEAGQELARLADELEELRETYIRPLSHRLHPNIIALGLAAGLRSLRDHVERAIPVDLDIAPEVDALEGDEASAIPHAERLCLYRVAEEALANVLKHSQATRAEIGLWMGSDKRALLLSIRDDGQGFDPQEAGWGLGFTTMDDYLRALGGSYILDAAPGRGTRITAMIPLGCAPDAEGQARRGVACKALAMGETVFRDTSRCEPLPGQEEGRADV